MLVPARRGLQFILISLALSVGLWAEDATQPSPRDQAWEVLRSAIADPKATRRMDAVKALSLISGNRTAERLALHALEDKEARVRSAAAATLGQLHAVGAIPALKNALADKDISVVLAASYALFTLKDQSVYGIYYAILMGDRKASAGPIQAQLDRLKDPKQVAEIGLQEGMGFVPFGGMGFEAYRMLLKHDTAPVRATAARLLAHDPDPMSGDALIQIALADKNDIVRQAALDALAERGDPACIERLMRNLTEGRSAVRYRTAAAIIHLSTRRTNKASPKLGESRP